MAPVVDSEKLTRDLRRHLKREGASLVGFGNIQRMAGAPEIQRPERYLPTGKSLISIAIHINEAVCDHIIGRKPVYHSFMIYTLGIVNPMLDRLAFFAAGFLEDRGFKSYPFPANSPHDLRPSEGYGGGPGDVSHKHIAVCCGLGEMGWHTMLLTPEYGTRQKLVTVITEAPLIPDPMLDHGELCDSVACGFRCAKICPTAALPRKREEGAYVNVTVDGKELEYCNIIGWRCRWGCSGMLMSTGGYKNIPMPRNEPTDDELLEYKAMVDPWQRRAEDKSYAGTSPYCGKCLAVCPVQMGKYPYKRKPVEGMDEEPVATPALATDSVTDDTELTE